MTTKEIQLVWISVKDLHKAVKFYTDVIGLKLCELHEDFGWAELSGQNGGCRLGISQTMEGCSEDVSPGGNAVPTLTVDDIEKSSKDMQAKGLNLHGSLQEVPGHVKLQMFIDQDGNKMQLVEML